MAIVYKVTLTLSCTNKDKVQAIRDLWERVDEAETHDLKIEEVENDQD